MQLDIGSLPQDSHVDPHSDSPHDGLDVPLEIQRLHAREDPDFQAPVQTKRRGTRASTEQTNSSLRRSSNLKTRIKKGTSALHLQAIPPSNPGRL
jgi:hypothetical protein